MKTRDLIFSLIFFLILIPALLAPIISKPVPPVSHFPTEAQAVQQAIAWLHTQQQTGGERDGAIGNAGTSCDVARVLALAGENPDGPVWTPGQTSLLQRCILDLPDIFTRDDAGTIAKVLRTAAATGQNPRDFGGYDLIAMLQAHYDAETGLYHPKSVFRDTLSVLAMEEAGQPVPEAAVQALIGQQNSDGCWGWPIDADVTDTDTTGLVIEAIAGAGQPEHPAITQCIDTLIAHQQPDGGWEARWGDAASNSDSTALVIKGLLAAGRDPKAPEFTPRDWNAVQALLSFQAADGSFWWKRNKPGTLTLGTTHALPPLIELSQMSVSDR